MTVDIYKYGTKEYDKLFDYLFFNYFPDYTMELVDKDNLSETYCVNSKHKVFCVRDSFIEITKNFYNK